MTSGDRAAAIAAEVLRDVPAPEALADADSFTRDLVEHRAASLGVTPDEVWASTLAEQAATAALPPGSAPREDDPGEIARRLRRSR